MKPAALRAALTRFLLAGVLLLAGCEGALDDFQAEFFGTDRLEVTVAGDLTLNEDANPGQVVAMVNVSLDGRPLYSSSGDEFSKLRLTLDDNTGLFTVDSTTGSVRLERDLIFGAGHLFKFKVRATAGLLSGETNFQLRVLEHPQAAPSSVTDDQKPYVPVSDTLLPYDPFLPYGPFLPDDNGEDPSAGGDPNGGPYVCEDYSPCPEPPSPLPGTEGSHYLVDSLSELQSIATGFRDDDWEVSLPLAVSLLAHYRLAADIDARVTASVSYTNGQAIGEGFLPIGTVYAPFNGSFDGAGYTIEGLAIRPSSSAGGRAFGLFGYVRGGLVRNLKLRAPQVRAQKALVALSYGVGSVVGWLEDGLLDNVQVTQAQVEGTRGVGGLVGFLVRSQIVDSLYQGAVYGDARLGGITGASFCLDDIPPSITNVLALASVSASGNVDEGYLGLIAGLNDGQVARAIAVGTVAGSAHVGGLVGLNLENGRVTHSLAKVRVLPAGSALDSLGGLVGVNGGIVQDSLALAASPAVPALVGAMVGWFNEPLEGVARRLYFVQPQTEDAASTTTDWPLGIGDQSDGDQSDSVSDVFGLPLSSIEALSCAGASRSVFHDTSDEGETRSCLPWIEGSFPWVFGVSSQLPVLREHLLDAKAQRVLLASDFSALSLEEEAAYPLAIAADALSLPDQQSTLLDIHWMPSEAIREANPAAVLTAPTLDVLAPREAGQYSILLSIHDGTFWHVDSFDLAVHAAYTVGTLQELQSIATGFRNASMLAPLTPEESLSASYLMTNDIDASPTNDEAYLEGAGFSPIPAFSGRFNGDGFRILGLHIRRTAENHVGLFESLHRGAVVRHLGLVRALIDGADDVGALVGSIAATDSSGSEGTPSDELSPTPLERVTVEDLYIHGVQVRGGQRVGGVVGSVQNVEAYLKAIFFEGDVSGTDAVGGIVGAYDVNTHAMAPQLDDLIATGRVTGQVDVGGILGHSGGSDGIHLQDAIYKGLVEGNERLGGIVGSIAFLDSIQQAAILERVLVLGRVVGTGALQGGLAGRIENTIISEALAHNAILQRRGDAAASPTWGRMVGQMYADSSLERSYWLDDTSIQTALGEGSQPPADELPPSVVGLSAEEIADLRCNADLLFRRPADDPLEPGLPCDPESLASFPWVVGGGDGAPVPRQGPFSAEAGDYFVHTDISYAGSDVYQGDVRLWGLGALDQFSGGHYHWLLPPGFAFVEGFPGAGEEPVLIDPETASWNERNYLYITAEPGRYVLYLSFGDDQSEGAIGSEMEIEVFARESTVE